jgi:hypothetical protein
MILKLHGFVTYTGYYGHIGEMGETLRSAEVFMEDEIKLDVPTHTTAAGLTRLAAGIFELLHDNSIDSRFVAELLKRMEKEAQLVIEKPVEAVKSADEFALRDALAQLRRPLGNCVA